MISFVLVYMLTDHDRARPDFFSVLAAVLVVAIALVRDRLKSNGSRRSDAITPS